VQITPNRIKKAPTWHDIIFRSACLGRFSFRREGVPESEFPLTERLPSVAGRFIFGMIGNVIEDCFVGDIAAGRAEVSSRPETLPPIAPA